MGGSAKWYVLTGGPSTGKTTLLADLEKRGYKTVPEAARIVIDEALSKGIRAEILRADEQAFQNSVAKLKAEIEKRTNPDEVTFFDRGMHDSWAYMKYYDYELSEWLRKQHEVSTYQRVFLLAPLQRYEQDYARTEDFRFAEKIQEYLYYAYTEFGMEPVVVPPMEISERAEYILQRL